MALLNRILYADGTRKSRLHDSNGTLHFSPEIFRALFSTAIRHAFKIYPNLPWLTYPAIRRLTLLVPGASVFEFGSGSSTKWFSEHARDVVSLENDVEWLQRVRTSLAERPNVQLIQADNPDDMTGALRSRPPFDIYLIDCQRSPDWSIGTEDLRIRCLEAAVDHNPGSATFIIDNTDVYKRLSARVASLFPEENIERLSGWVPGNAHPNETTIVRLDIDRSAKVETSN